MVLYEAFVINAHMSRKSVLDIGHSLENFICQTRTVCLGLSEQIQLPKLPSHIHGQSVSGWIMFRFPLKLYLNP